MIPHQIYLATLTLEIQHIPVSGRQDNAAQERVFIDQDGSLTSPDDICNNTSRATNSEFHVMIKEGK